MAGPLPLVRGVPFGLRRQGNPLQSYDGLLLSTQGIMAKVVFTRGPNCTFTLNCGLLSSDLTIDIIRDIGRQLLREPSDPIRRLEILQYMLENDDMEALLPALTAAVSLTALTITTWHQSVPNMVAFAAFIGLNRLTYLDVSIGAVTDAAASNAFMTALGTNTSITELRLDTNSKGCDDENLRNLIIRNSTIQILRLERMSDDTAQIVGEALASNSTLQFLSVAHGSFDSTVFRNLYTGIVTGGSITGLDMTFCRRYCTDVIGVITSIAYPRLTDLNISGVPTPQNHAAIQSYISAQPLRRLNVSYCGRHAYFLDAVIAGLEAHGSVQTLQVLDLSSEFFGNNIGSLCRYISRADCVLTELNLTFASVGRDEMNSLVRALIGTIATTRLTSLDVSHNNIGDYGCDALSTYIGMDTCKLENLDITHNWLPAASLRNFANALDSVNRNTRLRVLKMAHTAYDREAAGYLYAIARIVVIYKKITEFDGYSGFATHVPLDFHDALLSNFVLRRAYGVGTSLCDGRTYDVGPRLFRHYETPHVGMVVRTRVMCQAGRTHVAGSVTDIVAWLCAKAPLWVVVHVCYLLRDDRWDARFGEYATDTGRHDDD